MPVLITQILDAVPEAGHRGIDANDIFVTKQETYQDFQRTNLQPQLENFRTQANELSTSVNALSQNVDTKTLEVNTNTDLATSAALAAQGFADSALASSIVVNAYGNVDWAGFSVSDGDLIVDYFDSNNSVPSIVDGDFILTY